MRDCLHPDDLVTLSEVLGPDIHDALTHLQACPNCQSHMAALIDLRQALGARQPVGEKVLMSVVLALRAERAAERAIEEPARAALAAEAVLAALTGPTLLFTSGVNIDPLGGVAFAAVCGAGVLVARRLERRMSLVARV